jgi:multicomponent Na+:H+ antiporter subunit E
LAVHRRHASLFVWAFAAWVLLTWTRTLEQLLFGVGVAAATAVACAPLGSAAAPWALLRPARLAGLVRLLGWSAARIVAANLSLSRRIWSPSRPLRPGMVIVGSEVGTDGAVTAVALITSLIVDNQIIDLDRERRELQYHAVWIDRPDPEANRSRINGPLEARLLPFTRP